MATNGMYRQTNEAAIPRKFTVGRVKDATHRANKLRRCLLGGARRPYLVSVR